MEYIAQKQGDSPRTRCAKMMNHLKSVTTPQHLIRMSPPKNKAPNGLHDTHTKKWMSPPIMKTKSNRLKVGREP